MVKKLQLPEAGESFFFDTTIFLAFTATGLLVSFTIFGVDGFSLILQLGWGFALLLTRYVSRRRFSSDGFSPDIFSEANLSLLMFSKTVMPFVFASQVFGTWLG